MKALKHLNIDTSWTLFLDRDGVINKKREADYVKSLDEFVLLPGALEAIRIFASHFSTIVIVTNQQGIGKGLMTEAALHKVHHYLLEQVKETGGRIDGVYFCPELAQYNPICRKPEGGMALQAQKDFPSIDFSKSVMIGDSESDMAFGDRLGMVSIKIGASKTHEAYEALINVAEVISSQ